MSPIRSLRIVTLLTALVVAFILVGLDTSLAQAPTEDTVRIPAEGEEPIQEGDADAEEPAADPDAEEVAEPAPQQTEDTAQAPATQQRRSVEPLQEPTQQPPDTAFQQPEDVAEEPADTAMQQPADTTAQPPADTTAEQPADTTGAQPPSEPERAVNPDAPYEYVEFAEGEKPHAIIQTSMGDIEIELWPDVAPRHCQSFVHLARSDYYDSLEFFRVVPGFIIQTGDPLNNGLGGPGYQLPPEFSDRPHKEGTVSMARIPDQPNSAGSQFFICLARLQSLDGEYTAFGEVVDGLHVIHQIEEVPVAHQIERPQTPVYMLDVKMKSDETPEPAQQEQPEEESSTPEP
ncbi:MAG: hypothetical protein GF341_12635 [candidate division Zixibacteria bacterium]|nr:hypothetical protein [candidate division Zixibacteria bacterium]